MIFPGLDQIFLYVQVLPNFQTGHTIHWGINIDAPMKLRNATFTVQRAVTPEFEEVLWSETVDDVLTVVDTCSQQPGWSQDVYYRVGCTLDDGSTDGLTYYSHPVRLLLTSLVGRYQALAAEANRVKLKQSLMGGRPFWLLRRKIVGDTSGALLDPVTGAVLSSTGGDHGTGFTGGYFKPVQLPLTVESRQESRATSPEGNNVDEHFMLSGSCAGFPRMDHLDVIVDIMSGRRYVVQTVTSKRFPKTDIPITQVLTATLAPATDSVYSIPV